MHEVWTVLGGIAAYNTETMTEVLLAYNDQGNVRVLTPKQARAGYDEGWLVGWKPKVRCSGDRHYHGAGSMCECGQMPNATDRGVG